MKPALLKVLPNEDKSTDYNVLESFSNMNEE